MVLFGGDAIQKQDQSGSYRPSSLWAGEYTLTMYTLSNFIKQTLDKIEPINFSPKWWLTDKDSTA